MRIGCLWIGCLWIATVMACSSSTARDPAPERAAPTIDPPPAGAGDDPAGATAPAAAVPAPAGAPATAPADAQQSFRMASPPESTAFAYDPAADTNNTGRAGEVELSPRVLIALLGAPYVSDGTKVSGQYVFKGAKHVFTVYEWESTQNSSEGCGPMPAVFWMTDRPYAFHVGAPQDATKEDVRVFEAWLRAQVSTMLRKQHAKKVAALDRIVAQLEDKTITPAKAAASARSLRTSWKLGPVPAKKVKQPLTGGGSLGEFENWNAGGGKACDPFVEDLAYGREDPRSIWQEVLRSLVEDTDATAEAVASLRAFLAAKPGEEWNAWEEYSPTR